MQHWILKGGIALCVAGVLVMLSHRWHQNDELESAGIGCAWLGGFFAAFVALLRLVFGR